MPINSIVPVLCGESGLLSVINIKCVRKSFAELKGPLLSKVLPGVVPRGRDPLFEDRFSKFSKSSKFDEKGWKEVRFFLRSQGSAFVPLV